MQKYILCLASCASLGAGCSIHPHVDDFSRTSIPAIIEHIRCEAKAAIIPRLPAKRGYLNYAAISYDFTFTLTENNDAGSDGGSVVVPISMGNVKFGWNAGIDKQRFTQQKVKLGDTFTQLKDLDCSNHYPRRANLIYPISGSIGLDKVADNFIQLTSMKEGNELQIFSDELRFTTTVSADAAATVTLTPAIGRTIVAGLGASAKRDDQHWVLITIDPGYTDEQKIVEDTRLAKARNKALELLAQEKAIPTLVQVIDADNHIIEPPFVIEQKTPNTKKKKVGQETQSWVEDGGITRAKRKPRLLRRRLDRVSPAAEPTELEILNRARRKADDEQDLQRARELRDFTDGIN